MKEIFLVTDKPNYMSMGRRIVKAFATDEDAIKFKADNPNQKIIACSCDDKYYDRYLSYTIDDNRTIVFLSDTYSGFEDVKKEKASINAELSLIETSAPIYAEAVARAKIINYIREVLKDGRLGRYGRHSVLKAIEHDVIDNFF